MEIVLITAIVGTIILIRKDRSLPALMLAIGGVLALAFECFGDIIYIWITDGLLIISEDDPSWQLHLTVDAALDILKIAAGICAAIGYVIFFINYKPAKNSPSRTSRATQPLGAVLLT